MSNVFKSKNLPQGT